MKQNRIQFLGCPIDVLTMPETLALIDQTIKTRAKITHVVVNVAKIVNMRRDEELRQDVLNSDIINVDGAGIVLGCRVMGQGKVPRVTGIDLMEELLALCAKNSYRPYILGAKPEILEQAVKNIQNRYPTLQFAGWRDGYFKPEDETSIVQAIANSKADCLFVAMPSPTKERFIKKHAANLGVPFTMGVGGSVDVMAGFVRRAPTWVQNMHMEWLYRLAQEPRRLGMRYISTNTAYAGLLLKEFFNKS